MYPHHVDADPDSTYHADADPDSDYLFDADPDADAHNNQIPFCSLQKGHWLQKVIKLPLDHISVGRIACYADNVCNIPLGEFKKLWSSFKILFSYSCNFIQP